jgi:hypothetical protein
MVHKVAENAQFVTTTFHPELVKDADKCYGVTFANAVWTFLCEKVSSSFFSNFSIGEPRWCGGQSDGFALH